MRHSHSVLLALCVLAATAGAQVTIAPGFGVFLDISGTGTAVLTAGDDSAHAFTSTVGNCIFPAGTHVVTSNGYVVGGATPLGSTFTNAAVGAATTSAAVGYTAPKAVLLPYWDDLYATGFAATTIYTQTIGSTLYIQWTNIGHFATAGGPAGPAITFQVQVHDQGCATGALIQYIYPDATFGGAQAANDNGASATVGYIGAALADNAQFSFNTIGSIPDGTSLDVTKPCPPAFALNWSSPLGPGSVKVEVCGGTPLGMYQLLITVNAGAFPNGWLYGLDITFAEVAGELGAFPFNGPLDGAGGMMLGPFGGLPSGITLYSLAFDMPGPLPTVHTPAQAYTIP